MLFECGFGYSEEFNVLGFQHLDQILHVYLCRTRPHKDIIVNGSGKRSDLFPYASSTIITDINICCKNLKQTYTKL
jgi:hypothetical protein